MTAPEFSRPVRIDTVGEEPRGMTVAAEEGERTALARRFGLLAIDRLTAELTLRRDAAEIVMEGRLAAAIVQACVATGAPLEAGLEAPFEIRFRPQPDSAGGEEEVELDAAELDVLFYEGPEIDVGDAVAETLLLSLDPYPRAPGAADALKEAGVKSEGEAGPFAALAGLRDKLTK